MVATVAMVVTVARAVQVLSNRLQLPLVMAAMEDPPLTVAMAAMAEPAAKEATVAALRSLAPHPGLRLMMSSQSARSVEPVVRAAAQAQSESAEASVQVANQGPTATGGLMEIMGIRAVVSLVAPQLVALPAQEAWAATAG